MADGTIVEKKNATSPLKTPPTAVKENIANNKPQPPRSLKSTLESELNRMKSSAISASIKRPPLPIQRHQAITKPTPSPVVNLMNSPPGTRRITKFESWYVIDTKEQESVPPLKHTHTFSLVQLGNHIKEVELPSQKWDFKINLQKRLKKASSDEEVYTGEINDITADDNTSYVPSSILFKRSYRDTIHHNRTIVDRSVMIKPDSYIIHMNGKQCHFLGAPSDFKSLEDFAILLQIIDSSSLSHSCVETNC